MELRHLEKQRSNMVQILLFMVIVFLGLVSYLSFQNNQGYLIPSICIFALGACLYVIAKERSLKNLHADLIKEIQGKDIQVQTLNEELVDEKTHLHGEKEKSNLQGIRLQEITALYRAISIVNSVMDPDQTPDAFLRASMELADVSNGSLMFLDEKKEHLSIIATQGLSDRAYPTDRQPVGEGIAGWVAEHGEPLLLKGNIQEDERFKNLTERDLKVKSALLTPLKVRGAVIGVLNLTIPLNNTEKKFTEQDLRIISIFAQHGSIALENTQLIDKLKSLKASV